MSFHQYSWNYEVDTTWISLIGWPQKTSNMYIVVYIFCWHSKPEELPKRWQSSVSPSNAATHLNHFDNYCVSKTTNFDRYSTTPIALCEKQVVEFSFRTTKINGWTWKKIICFFDQNSWIILLASGKTEREDIYFVWFWKIRSFIDQ